MWHFLGRRFFVAVAVAAVEVAVDCNASCFSAVTSNRTIFVYFVNEMEKLLPDKFVHYVILLIREQILCIFLFTTSCQVLLIKEYKFQFLTKTKLFILLVITKG